MNFKTLILGVLLLPFLSSCGFFNRHYESTSEESEPGVPIDVTINYGDGEVSTQSVTTNDYAKINEKLKVGFGCLGFFDKEEGGVKYFDGSGLSVNVWQSDFPTVFYARYQAIELFKYSYTLNETHSFGHYISFGTKLNELLKTAEYKNALKANADKQIIFTFSFYGSESLNGNDWAVYFKTSNKYSEGNMTVSQIISTYQGIRIYPSDSFSLFSNTGYFTCRDASASGFYAHISRGATTGNGKITDYTSSIEFI